MKTTKLTLTSGTLILLAGFVIARTTGYKSSQSLARPALAVTIPEGAAERLAGALRIPTISPEDPAVFNDAAFQAMHAYLQKVFPRVHSELRREAVARQ